MLSRPTWLATAALLLAACRPPLPTSKSPALAPRRAEVVLIAPGELAWATATRGWMPLEGGRAAVLRFRAAAVRTRLAGSDAPVAATVRARVQRGAGELETLVAGARAELGDDGALAAARAAADAVGAHPDDLRVRAELAAPPSADASAQLAVSILASLLGDTPAADAAIVGRLGSDGTLAPAARAERLVAVMAGAGIERIGVPAVQFDADEAAALAREVGATVVLVDDLDAAYELVTGAELPAPAAEAVPALPAEVDERAAAALIEWRRELGQSWARVIATAEGAGVSAAARDAGAAALATARLAETARQRGATLAALWLTARARVEAEAALAAASGPPSADPVAPSPATPAASSPGAPAATTLFATPGAAQPAASPDAGPGAAASAPTGPDAAAASAPVSPEALAGAAWWSAVAPEPEAEAAAEAGVAADQRAAAVAAARALDEAAPALPAAGRQRQLALSRHRALATISAAATATGAEPAGASIWLTLGNELAAYDQAAALAAFRRASLEARLAISSARRRMAPPTLAPSAGSRPEGPPSPSAPPASR